MFLDLRFGLGARASGVWGFRLRDGLWGARRPLPCGMPVSRNCSFAPVRGLHECWLSSMETRYKNGPWGEGVTIPGLGSWSSPTAPTLNLQPYNSSSPT